MKQTILDTAIAEKNKSLKANFLHEWTPEQFKAIEKAISKHFSFKQLRTLHGNYPAYYMGFKALDQIIGLAYTSTSSFAGYWPCNTEVYNDKYPGFHYSGFAINNEGKCFAILDDKDENEIILPLK